MGQVTVAIFVSLVIGDKNIGYVYLQLHVL